LTKVSRSRLRRSGPDHESQEEFLPFCRPSIDATDIEAVVQVLQSGWITSGAKVRQLEQLMTEVTQCAQAVAVSSATAGMHLVLHSLGIGPGDEVITPSLTWVSTVNLITLSGAKPVFVDIDRDTLMTDAELVEKAITPRTKLIVPVHYAGAALNLDPLKRLAEKHGIPLVEDAAHALGTAYKGEPVGRTGTAIFSFQAIKNVTTAEGGMVCTDNAELAERLRRLRFHGLGADAFDRETHGRLASAEVLEPGYKYNLPDMNACLALGQLGRLKELIRMRSEIAASYLEVFEDNEFIRPLAAPDYPFAHAWHMFIIRVNTDKLGMTRDQFMVELKLRQIGSGIHFLAAHKHRYYRDNLAADMQDVSNTNWNSDRVVTLPLFPAMRATDIDRVVGAIQDITFRNS
jgi:UDP-4-amino-4-deoxy-L-arabinose-oxoglutarate aminotransferase